MKLSIIQFSDIHFNNTRKNFLIEKKEKLVCAVKNELLDCNKIIFIITGDIAQKGHKEEYEIAEQFFYEIKEKLEEYTKNKLTF